MTLALARSFEVTQEGGHGLPSTATATLEKLRAMALKCRATRRLDLDRACRMLSSDSRVAGRAFASALVRTLSQGLGRTPVFYKPGSVEISFDERWLISLMASVQHDDTPSFDFLIRSRLARQTHRPTAFLVRNLASRLDTL